MKVELTNCPDELYAQIKEAVEEEISREGYSLIKDEEGLWMFVDTWEADGTLFALKCNNDSPTFRAEYDGVVDAETKMQEYGADPIEAKEDDYNQTLQYGDDPLPCVWVKGDYFYVSTETMCEPNACTSITEYVKYKGIFITLPPTGIYFEGYDYPFEQEVRLTLSADGKLNIQYSLPSVMNGRLRSGRSEDAQIPLNEERLYVQGWVDWHLGSASECGTNLIDWDEIISQVKDLMWKSIRG